MSEGTYRSIRPIPTASPQASSSNTESSAERQRRMSRTFETSSLFRISTNFPPRSWNRRRRRPELSSDCSASLSDDACWIIGERTKQLLDLRAGDRIDIDVHLSGVFKKLRVVHGTHKSGAKYFQNAGRHIWRSSDRAGQEYLLEMQLQNPAFLVRLGKIEYAWDRAKYVGRLRAHLNYELKAAILHIAQIL